MVFSNLIFLYLFLPVCLIAYFFCPGIRAKNAVLILFSLIFYAWGEPVYLLLMIASAAVNWYFGLLIERRRKKIFLILALVLDLGCLAVFKYAGFFVENLNAVFGASIPVPQIALPIGISFYTFQTMSYTIDVYRGLVPPQRNIVDFGAYVTLFPQLIAGPIVQYKTVAYDLEHRRESVSEASEGLQRLVIGLGKKVLIANQMGAIWEDIAAMSDPTAVTAWIGAIAYTFQIYFDFSGYSDMAIGLGHFFGFHFLENFNYPYESRSVTEFWRRWHISLTTWFREYLYIPLGGSRKGTWRTVRNIFLVWFCTGFWHGASWNFILWGLHFFVWLMLEKYLLRDFLQKLPSWLRHFYTLVVVFVGWGVFAMENLTGCAGYFKTCFGSGSPSAIRIMGQ